MNMKLTLAALVFFTLLSISVFAQTANAQTATTGHLENSYARDF